MIVGEAAEQTVAGLRIEKQTTSDEGSTRGRFLPLGSVYAYFLAAQGSRQAFALESRAGGAQLGPVSRDRAFIASYPKPNAAWEHKALRSSVFS